VLDRWLGSAELKTAVIGLKQEHEDPISDDQEDFNRATIALKAAKAANIATDRPEAIWQSWQSWQSSILCAAEDKRSSLDSYPFMRNAHRTKSYQAATSLRNSLIHRALEMARGDLFPISLSEKAYCQV